LIFCITDTENLTPSLQLDKSGNLLLSPACFTQPAAQSLVFLRLRVTAESAEIKPFLAA